MRNDDELIHLIREDKRKHIPSLHIALDMDCENLGDYRTINATVNTNMDRAHFTLDKDSVIAQMKIVTQLMVFETEIAKMRRKYIKSVESIYGPVMKQLAIKYNDAYMSNPPDLFGMRDAIRSISDLVDGLRMREDNEEAIFDAKRIESDLANLSEVDDGDND